MKKFMIWFTIIGKRILKTPLLLVLLILLPVISLIAGSAKSTSPETAYKVGIYVDGDDHVSAELAERLFSYEGSYVFTEYTDIDELYRDVKNTSLVGGYIFPDDLSRRTADADCEKSIKVIKQPSSTIQGSINEIVYSELIAVQGRFIITDHINSLNLFDENDTEHIDRLMKYYNEYLESDVTFHLLYKSYGIDGLQESSDEVGVLAFPVRGILAILVFLAGLLGAITYMRDNEKGVFVSLPNNYRRLCIVLYTAIPTAAFGIVSLICLSIQGQFYHVGSELSSMLMLVTMTTVFAVIMTRITRSSKIFTAFLPILLLGCLIFCPVFINAGNYIPAARFVEKLFIPYYYLELFM